MTCWALSCMVPPPELGSLSSESKWRCSLLLVSFDSPQWCTFWLQRYNVLFKKHITVYHLWPRKATDINVFDSHVSFLIPFCSEPYDMLLENSWQYKPKNLILLRQKHVAVVVDKDIIVILSTVEKKTSIPIKLIYW